MTTNHSTPTRGAAARCGKGQAEAYWHRACRQWERSGLRQEEFCRRHGLSVWSLRWWRCELKRRNRQDHEKKGKPLFVPVRVVEPSANAGALEVELRGGRIIRIRRDFDPGLLRKLIAALEEDGRC